MLIALSFFFAPIICVSCLGPTPRKALSLGGHKKIIHIIFRQFPPAILPVCISENSRWKSGYILTQTILSVSICNHFSTRASSTTQGKNCKCKFPKENMIIYLSWTHKLNVCLEVKPRHYRQMRGAKKKDKKNYKCDVKNI